MSRGTYSVGKRQRDADKARKKQDKAQKRMLKRERGPGEVEITTADQIAGGLPSVDEAMRALENRNASPRGAAAIPCRLFVGGLAWETTDAHLRGAFAEFGGVADASVVVDRDTGRSRGFGFVTMENRKDAAKAIDALDGSDLDGRNIVVNVATERSR